MLNHTDMLFLRDYMEEWEQTTRPTIKKQEWRKVQHLIKCLKLCHFYDT